MLSDVAGPWPYEMLVIAAMLNGGGVTNLATRLCRDEATQAECHPLVQNLQ